MRRGVEIIRFHRFIVVVNHITRTERDLTGGDVTGALKQEEF